MPRKIVLIAKSTFVLGLLSSFTLYAEVDARFSKSNDSKSSVAKSSPVRIASAPSANLMAIKSQLTASINQSVHFLRMAEKEGKWLNHPGVTALCLQGILGCYRQYNENDGPWIREPMNYLLQSQQKDGAFYDPKARMPVKSYCTALAILAISESNNPKYKEQIISAQKFLVEIQCDEGESYVKEKDYSYGGIGYGGDERPDLSNLQLSLEALKASGLPIDHPAYKKAMVFIQRCQDSEGNDMEWAGSSGGFAYSPDIPSNARLAKDVNEKPVSPYGSMTFAGIKSMIFCNIEKTDPRVQDALLWIGKNFSVTENPKRGQDSLYYYYLIMAKALEVANVIEIPRNDGIMIDWRYELARELLKRQEDDGHWVNSDKKYMEGSPELCTAYALNTLNIIYKAFQ